MYNHVLKEKGWTQPHPKTITMNEQKEMFPMKITALKKIYNPKEPIFLDYSFEKLVDFIGYPREYKEKKEIPAWSPATFKDGKLTNDNVESVSCAVFDIDEGLEFEAQYNFKKYKYIAHQSYSSTVKKHKWRLVIPFTQPVPSHLWDGAWLQCKRFFFEHTGQVMDEKCKDARRFYFLNNKCGDGNLYIANRNMEGETMSIDFQKCENYKAQLEQEQKDKIERMKRRYNAIQSLPAYMQNPKESLHLKLSTDSSYREQLGIKIGGRNSGGTNPRMTGWECPSCGRNDATYFYIHPQGNKLSAQCGHMNSCGQWFTLFQLGRNKGIC